MPKRIRTNYPGVYYREAKRIGGNGVEKVFYITFKKSGKMIEEKVGRQFMDDMTPARATGIRADRIEGKRLSRKETRGKQLKRKNEVLTIDEIWGKYRVTRLENKSLSIDTGRYRKHLKPHFGARKPEEILLDDIDQLKNKWAKTKSPQTVKHILNLFTWIINYGVKRNLCPPLTFHIEKPQVHNEKTEDLNSEELKRLIAAIEKDTNITAKNMMKLALCTGMRRGEMFKLKWEHVDFDRGFISIVDPKGGPDQKIPINNGAKKILTEHPKTEGSEYVFPGRNGGQRVTISKAVNRIRKRAGLPKTLRPLHGLRHTFASSLASSGKVDLYTLQKLLTHKDPRMTQRYAHLRDEALKKASAVAADLFQQIPKAEEPESKKILTSPISNIKL